MKRVKFLIGGLALLGLAAGCANPVAGTWVASGPPDAKNPIARVSFCQDGTFTAEAEYGGGKSHAMSGCYTVSKDRIELCTDGKMRNYAFKVSGDCLEMMHEGKVGKLCRVKFCKPESCCGPGCTKPCCPKKTAACPPGCTKPCCAKKA